MIAKKTKVTSKKLSAPKKPKKEARKKRNNLRGRPAYDTYCYNYEQSKDMYVKLAAMSHFNGIMEGDLVSITTTWPEGVYATRAKSYKDLFSDPDPCDLSWHEVVVLSGDGLVGLKKDINSDIILVPFHVLKTEQRDYVKVNLSIGCVRDLLHELKEFVDNKYGFVIKDMAVDEAMRSMEQTIHKYDVKEALRECEEKEGKAK